PGRRAAALRRPACERGVADHRVLPHGRGCRRHRPRDAQGRGRGPVMIYFVAVIAGLAGILFGFDEGVIAGALGFLRDTFAIAPGAGGLMTAAVPLGALLGAVAAGYAAERLGRRASLLAAAVLFILGAVASSLISAVWMLS